MEVLKQSEISVNQLILLLDIYRGYERCRHPGTLQSDLHILTLQGYITCPLTPTITPQGQQMIKKMQQLFN